MTCASMDLSQGARESRPVRTKRSLPSKIFMYGVRSEMADLRRAYCAHQIPQGEDVKPDSKRRALLNAWLSTHGVRRYEGIIRHPARTTPPAT